MDIKRLRVYELVGVAGSGKTTLLNYILSNYSEAEKKPGIKKLAYTGIWIVSLMEVFYGLLLGVFSFKSGKNNPGVHSSLSQDRRYNYYEFKQLTQLSVITRVIEKLSNKRDRGILIIDQGPIYMLAALNVVCGTADKPQFGALLDRCKSRYVKALDGILYLDIPFEFLRSRWQLRADWKDYVHIFESDDRINNHHLDYQSEYSNLVFGLVKQKTKIVALTDPDFDLESVSKKLLEGQIDEKYCHSVG